MASWVKGADESVESVGLLSLLSPGVVGSKGLPVYGYRLPVASCQLAVIQGVVEGERELYAGITRPLPKKLLTGNWKLITGNPPSFNQRIIPSLRPNPSIRNPSIPKSLNP